MLVLGLAAYGALFAFVGARLKRPLLVGLLFALGWEPVVLLAPGYLKRLTVAYYLQALVMHEMPQEACVGALLQSLPRGPAAQHQPDWPGRYCRGGPVAGRANG